MKQTEEIKQKLDIVDFISQSVNLKKAGRNFKGLCPFHSEKSPSFMVSPELQIFKCFGCGVGGDIFNYYMLREGVGFVEALKDLADLAGVELKTIPNDKNFNLNQELEEINQKAAKYFQYLLQKHDLGKEAREYLQKRGVTKHQQQQFMLGYAPNAWQGLVNYLAKKEKYSIDLILKTGLIIQSKGRSYDRFRGRIIFPLYDHRGHLVGFSGRILPKYADDKSGKYINSPETSLYHKSKLLYPFFHVKDSIRKHDKVVIVEGELDVFASHRAGVDYCVAVKGSALTSDQVRLIKRYTDNIILSLDSDQAGLNAAKRAIEVAKSFDINLKVIYLPQGKDPDELIKKDPKLWKKVVKSAISIYDFFLKVALEKYDLTKIDDKQKMADEQLAIIADIDNAIVQDHFLHKLSDILKVKVDVLIRQMHKRPVKKQKNNKSQANWLTQTVQNKTQTRIEKMLQQYLSYVLINYKNLQVKDLKFAEFPDSAVKKILTLLYKNKPQSLSTFMASLPEELYETFQNCWLAVEEESDADLDFIKIQNLQNDIVKLELRDKLAKLRVDFKNSAEEQKPQLLEEINQILHRLNDFNN